MLPLATILGAAAVFQTVESGAKKIANNVAKNGNPLSFRDRNPALSDALAGKTSRR